VVLLVMEVEALLAGTTEVATILVTPVGTDLLQVREVIAIETLLMVEIDPRVLAAVIDFLKISAYGKLDKGELR